MKTIRRQLPVSVFFFTLIVSLIGLTINSNAEEYQGFHKGIRPLGMGGAFTAVADDHNSIFYNPAGLSQADGFGLGILDPYVSVSENSLDLINDFNDIDTDNTEEVNNLLKQYVGENNNFKIAADVYTGFSIRNVGVMVDAVALTDTTVNIHNPVWPEAHITSVVDYGVMLGAGLPISAVPGLKVGATLKTLQRKSLDKVYTAIDISDDSQDFSDKLDDDMESGSGISLDLGLLYSVQGIPFTSLDLALTGQNLPEMDFGDAVDSKTQYNIGVALRQKLGFVEFVEAADYLDITDNLTGDDSMEKKLHLGVEAKMPVVAVRAGINQGYYTLGATIDLWIFKFDIATYGEEIGYVAGQDEDRRIAGQISMGWSW